MYAEQSTFDWRRYGHWNSSANKAWLSAYVLWRTRSSGKVTALQTEARYSSGDAELGLLEGFSRESSVALELIIKAVIAKQLDLARSPPTVRVPAIHDIPKLWALAGLAKLSREDQYRLIIFKSILMWSGRYATPKSVRAWAQENQEFRECIPSSKHKKGVLNGIIHSLTLRQTALSILALANKPLFIETSLPRFF